MVAAPGRRGARLALAHALALALGACAGGPAREPAAVPLAQLQALHAALSVSNPTMWSGAVLVAQGSDVLLIDLRVTSAVGSQEFAGVCAAAGRFAAAHLPPDARWKIRLVRQWRVIHECAPALVDPVLG
jgi:hypothetical protein